jgi:hypothetical protein
MKTCRLCSGRSGAILQQGDCHIGGWIELPIFSNANRERGADPLITAGATQRPSLVFRRADAGASRQIELDVRLA